MYTTDGEPLLWLVELGAYLTLLSALQLVAGFATVALIPARLSPSSKLATVLTLILVLAAIYRTLVDHRTHLIACMLGGLSLSFTVPLNAVALLSLAHRGKPPTGGLETILRISFPIAAPSPKHAPEQPRTQLLRGLFYLALMVFVTAPLFLRVRAAAGLRANLAAAAVMFTVAPAVLNLCAALAGALGAPSPSPFRAPFLSPSLGAFWAGRWNAPVSGALRAGVYDPLRAAGVSPALGVLACFAVSGAAHEAIMVYSRAYGSGGLWMAFFMLHGALVVLERAATKYGARWLPPPGVRRWPLIASLMFASFVAMFVPAARRTGLDRAGVESFSELATVAAAVVALIKDGRKL